MMTVDVAFSGTAEDKKVASALFDLMRGHGRFMANDEPIRVAFDSVVEYLSRDGSTIEVEPERLRKIIEKNSKIFALEQREDVVLILTTRAGISPIVRELDQRHTFAARFMTPLPKPEVPATPVRERPRVAKEWRDLDEIIDRVTDRQFLNEDDELDLELELGPETEVIADVEPAPIVQDVIVVPEIEAEPVPARTIRAAVPQATLFTGVDDLALANGIKARLAEDPRVANFGDEWMLEDRVPRFSRGDLRRLREYIQEQEQPLADDLLAIDVLGGRVGAPDFDALRFAVNFRLSKEHREFEFVGTNNQRFWGTANLPPIGTTRRKPNEIGTDYRFLTEEVDENVAPGSMKGVDHVLTFYEYSLGLLPFNEHMQALFPAPLLPSQKSAVITLECLQTYTTYLVELRYPTPNRGGFVLGLDDFYNESLVPGAMITIERTENDGHYLVKFIASPQKSARLLELDDRRQRYVFRPTSFACEVLDEYLLSEERFPNFGSEKPLDEKVRRRPESVVSATFERLGHKSDGPGFVATFDELMAAVNIERPFSERMLRAILETDETGAFARDPDGHDAYTYVPGNGG